MADASGSRSTCVQCGDYARFGTNDGPRQRTDINGKIVFLHLQCDGWYNRALVLTATAAAQQLKSQRNAGRGR